MSKPLGSDRWGTGWLSPSDIHLDSSSGDLHLGNGARWSALTGGAVPTRNWAGPWPLWPATALNAAKGKGSNPETFHKGEKSVVDLAKDVKIDTGRSWACFATGPCHACPRDEVSAASDSRSERRRSQRMLCQCVTDARLKPSEHSLFADQRYSFHAQIHQPWCEPYGARRPIECALVTSASTQPSLNGTASSASPSSSSSERTGAAKEALPLDSRARQDLGPWSSDVFKLDKRQSTSAPLVRTGYETCGKDVEATRSGWVSFLVSYP